MIPEDSELILNEEAIDNPCKTEMIPLFIMILGIGLGILITKTFIRWTCMIVKPYRQ